MVKPSSSEMFHGAPQNAKSMVTPVHTLETPIQKSMHGSSIILTCLRHMIDNFFIFFLRIKDIIYYSLDILKMIIHSFVDKSIPHRSFEIL